MIGAENRQSLPVPPDVRREHIRGRVEQIKRMVVVGTVIAFGAIWALVAHHVVGVTASSGSSSNVSQTNASPPPAQSPDSNGFFGNGGDAGAVGSGGGNGAGPVLGSGGS
jgi:hypothetical protein